MVSCLIMSKVNLTTNGKYTVLRNPKDFIYQVCLKCSHEAQVDMKMRRQKNADCVLPLALVLLKLRALTFVFIVS